MSAEWKHLDKGDHLVGFEHPAVFPCEVMDGGESGLGEGWRLHAVVMEGDENGGTHSWAVMASHPTGDAVFYDGWNGAPDEETAKQSAHGTLLLAIQERF